MAKKKRKKHEEVPALTPADPQDEDRFMFEVAELAWRDGISCAGIYQELKDRYALSKGGSGHHRIQSALARAHSRGVLQFNIWSHNQLEAELAQRFNTVHQREIHFHVVDDRLRPSSGTNVVHAKAAEVAMSTIRRVFEKEDHETARSAADVVVCNAGGRTVAEMVRHLQRFPAALDHKFEEAERRRARLQFVAANNAYGADRFHHSANFIAVTLAEQFGTRHKALERVLSRETREEHRRLVEAARLFICGAGTIRPGRPEDQAERRRLGLLANLLIDWGIELPEGCVGDLAFNLLSPDGQAVDARPELKQQIQEVNPTVTLELLQRIVMNQSKDVLVILDSHEPEDKLALAIAVLKTRCVTHAVLGARLAGRIVETLPGRGALSGGREVPAGEKFIWTPAVRKGRAKSDVEPAEELQIGDQPGKQTLIRVVKGEGVEIQVEAAKDVTVKVRTL
jgi:DNA-binding transcriptional regulator LsrR (DeoR family)